MGTKNQKKKKDAKGAAKATKKHKAQKAAREDVPMVTYEVPDAVWESDTTAKAAPSDMTSDTSTQDVPSTLGSTILGAFVLTMFAVGTLTTCVIGLKVARHFWKMRT